MQDESQLTTGDIVKFDRDGDTITGIVKYTGGVADTTVAVPEACEHYSNGYTYVGEDKLTKVGHTDKYDPQDPFGSTVAECLENAKDNDTVSVRCKQCSELFQMNKTVAVKYGKTSYCTEACGIKATKAEQTIGRSAY